jgi:serine/threonine protein kinase
LTEQAGSLGLVGGTIIQDCYRVISRIGGGGMGAVYMVEHTVSGRLYALKVLHQVAARDPEVIARIHREATTTAIDDEHILEVVDVGKLGNGAPYLVTELLDGRDLGKVLKNKEPMPVVRAVNIATQCCRALGEAHKRGIIHRDIKPQNIFITERTDGSEFVKILDIGIAKIREAAGDMKDGPLNELRITMGPPQYLSIEQMNGVSDIDARTDVYAMGVVLFQMLTGRAPFDASTYAALLMKVVNDPPPSLVELRSDVSPALEQVVHRALAKKREERFASMAELAEALAPFAEFEGASTRTDSNVLFNLVSTSSVWKDRTLSLSARFLSTRALVISGLVGVALGALVFFTHGRREATNATSTDALSQSEPALARRSAETAPGNTALAARPLESGSLSTPASGSAPPKELAAAESNNSVGRSPQTEASSEVAYRKGRPEQLADEPTERKAPRSQQDKRGKPLTNPASRVLASPVIGKREPLVAPMRSVALRNAIRASVTVTFKCESASVIVSVSQRGQTSARVPPESCQVSCTGMGGPVCPSSLSADAVLLEIR